MHIAVKEGMALGYKHFVIFGGTGGRLSHTMANIQLLAELASEGCEAVLMGTNSRIFVIHNSKISFEKEEEGYISVFSLSDRSEGVSPSRPEIFARRRGAYEYFSAWRQ